MPNVMINFQVAGRLKSHQSHAYLVDLLYFGDLLRRNFNLLLTHWQISSNLLLVQYVLILFADWSDCGS